jgi:type IV secretion system protein VirB10
MVPPVEGSIFGSSAQQQQGGQYSQNAANNAGQNAYADYLGSARAAPQQSSYAAQNNQADKTSFYNASSASGGVIAGNFLQADILWIGTIIPAVLETAINTDLPGNVIARVTQNIYDSHTGKKLLIPQGTLLIAKYNSSVSYAQRRIQIVWDLLIRPDGYQLELEGMNGVDPKGMAGLKAKYNENWFEYVKAAGIITMFTFATSKITEEAAKYATSETASAVAQGNAQFVQQMGGGVIDRAMNIQPTLTVPSGEKIIVMLNKNIYFPPMPGVPVVQKYTLGR